VGKTRLALAATDEHDRGAGQVWFADLVSAATGSQVLSTVAGLLQLADSVGQSAEGIAGYLRHQRGLLVLDNCEQGVGLLTEAVRLAERLGEPIVLGSTLEYQAHAAFAAGSHRQAADLTARALAAYQRIGYQEGIASAGTLAASLAALTGQRENADHLLAQAYDACQRMGHAAAPPPSSKQPPSGTTNAATFTQQSRPWPLQTSNEPAAAPRSHPNSPNPSTGSKRSCGPRSGPASSPGTGRTVGPRPPCCPPPEAESARSGLGRPPAP
jgi:hypothetical protein